MIIADNVMAHCGLSDAVSEDHTAQLGGVKRVLL
jgi:hypothetical protein